MHPSPSTYDEQDPDTGSIRAIGLTSPSRTRHTWIGLGIGISSVLWLASIASVVLTHVLEWRSVPAIAMLIAASTATVCTCMLAASTASQRANVDDHRAIKGDLAAMEDGVTVALGTLHARVEQVSAQVNKIDPWTIYTAVASDILGLEARNGNGGRLGGS